MIFAILSFVIIIVGTILIGLDEYGGKEIEKSSVNNNTSYFNELGEQGWEMCGYDGRYGVAVFKRIKR